MARPRKAGRFKYFWMDGNKNVRKRSVSLTQTWDDTGFDMADNWSIIKVQSMELQSFKIEKEKHK